MLLIALRGLLPSIRRFLKWTGLAVCAVIYLTSFQIDFPHYIYLFPIIVTLAITSAILFWKNQQYGVFAVLVGVLAISCQQASLGWWIGLGWSRPVHDWMMAHGMSAYAAYYGLFHISIPAIILNLVGGAFVGFCGYRRWPQYALLFGATYFALSYMPSIMDGSPFSMLLLYNLLYNLMTIPFAICGAWLAPGRRRRYEAWLAAEGFCKKGCGYNLTGNTSGICPECGTPLTERQRSLLAGAAKPGSVAPGRHEQPTRHFR